MRGGQRVGSFLRKLRQSEFYFTKSDKGKQTDIFLARYSIGQFDPESFSTDVFYCGWRGIYGNCCHSVPTCISPWSDKNLKAMHFSPVRDKFELVEELLNEPSSRFCITGIGV